MKAQQQMIIFNFFNSSINPFVLSTLQQLYNQYVDLENPSDSQTSQQYMVVKHYSQITKILILIIQAFKASKIFQYQSLKRQWDAHKLNNARRSAFPQKKIHKYQLRKQAKKEMKNLNLNQEFLLMDCKKYVQQYDQPLENSTILKRRFSKAQPSTRSFQTYHKTM